MSIRYFRPASAQLSNLPRNALESTQIWIPVDFSILPESPPYVFADSRPASFREASDRVVESVRGIRDVQSAWLSRLSTKRLILNPIHPAKKRMEHAASLSPLQKPVQNPLSGALGFPGKVAWNTKNKILNFVFAFSRIYAKVYLFRLRSTSRPGESCVTGLPARTATAFVPFFCLRALQPSCPCRVPAFTRQAEVMVHAPRLTIRGLRFTIYCKSAKKTTRQLANLRSREAALTRQDSNWCFILPRVGIRR
jgi:hypothetical protein